MNYSRKKVSIAVVKRLPRYYRYLSDLITAGITRISSMELSKRMGITASQIRQDLNCFGGFGQQGYGYNVEYLLKEIGNILGINERFNVIIIGAGHMGHALANYSNFSKRGFDIIGIFDANPQLVGNRINNLEVLHCDKLDEFVAKNSVDIGILAIPYEQTRSVAERLSKLGIHGLWNFSPMDLHLNDVIIENVHLSDSLMVLGYKLQELRLQKEEAAKK